MQKDKLEEFKQKVKGMDAPNIIKVSFDYIGEKNIALASSMSAEDQVLTDMMLKYNSNAQIFTIDTGRLPQETYDVIDLTRKKYGIKIEVLFPKSKSVERTVNEHGANLFYDSVDLRKLCCNIRKAEPLRKKLSTLKAWICGIRRDQSITRNEMTAIEWDYKFNLFKVNPIIEWKEKQVWAYIKENKIPYNILHDKEPTSG